MITTNMQKYLGPFILFLSTVSIESVYGSSSNGMVDLSEFLKPWQGSEMPVCSSAVKPCDMAIEILNDGVYSRITPKDVMCACPGENSCPRGWDVDRNKTIRMELKSAGKSTLVQFNYCESKPILPVCVGDQVALKTLEVGLFPEEILENNCRCQDGNHLVLRKIKGVHHRRNQEYVCQMAECDVTQREPTVCLQSRWRRFGVYTTTFTCQCGEGFKCSTDRRSARRRLGIQGYCEAM